MYKLKLSNANSSIGDINLSVSSAESPEINVKIALIASNSNYLILTVAVIQ